VLDLSPEILFLIDLLVANHNLHFHFPSDRLTLALGFSINKVIPNVHMTRKWTDGTSFVTYGTVSDV